MRGMMRGVVVAVLVCLGMCGSVWAQGPTADRAAVAFYRWYLHELAANQIPLSHPKGEIRRYVAPELLRELRRVGSPESDYFLKAQDTLEDWEANVHASAPVVGGGTADTTVTMGATTASAHVLLVRLVRREGRWKIRRVRLAN